MVNFLVYFRNSFRAKRKAVRWAVSIDIFLWIAKHLETKMKHPVDLHVGQWVRQRRWLLGMTQQQLAEKVGIKFQQIQKYETGANRISSSRLWDISEVMDVPVSFFFDGLDRIDDREAGKKNILEDKEALDLVRCYYAFPENQRKRLFDLARVLGDAA